MRTKPRNVVFVAQAPFIGGAEISIQRFATALDRDRYRPSIVTAHRGDFTESLRDSDLEHRQIPLPMPDRRRPWSLGIAVARLAADLRRRNAALVHVCDATAHPVPALAARLLGIPRLCHLHCSYPGDGLRWYLRWGFEHALFPSQFLRRHALHECPDLFHESRCTVIPNAFDPPPTPAKGRLQELRRECALHGAAPVLGFVGRVVGVKGVDDFLQMARALLAVDPRLQFLVVGDDHGSGPNHRVAMQELAHALGIAAACRFLGFREDVWDLLHVCDVVVMPSHDEPFGNMAMEAGAAGRPLVATRVGGIPEIVCDGETGLLVPPRDPSALSRAASELLSKPALRARMGAAAARHVRSALSLEAQARALADLYDAMVAAPRGHSRSRATASPAMTKTGD